VKAAAGLGLVLWYAANLNWDEVVLLLKQCAPISLVAAAGLIGVSIVLATVRWVLLLRPFGVSLPYCNASFMTLIAVFYNVFTPGGIAGDAIRAVQAKGFGFAGSHAMSSVVTDRILGLLGLTVLAIGGLAMTWSTFMSVGLAGLFVALVPLIALSIPALYSRRVSRLLSRWLPVAGRPREVLAALDASLKIYRGARTTVVVAVLLSIVSNFFIVASSYAVAVGIGTSISFGYFLAFIPPVLVLSTLPITVGGFGVREGAYLLLFPLVGMGKVEALGTSLLFTLTLFAVALIGGILGFALEFVCRRRTRAQ